MREIPVGCNSVAHEKMFFEGNLTMAIFMSLFMHISCASSIATLWPLL